MNPSDLESYLSRIGYDGPRTPTVETLAALQLRHASSIPFENLDPLLGREVRLDLASLQAKLVQGRRGGYCFEHNLLFQAALRTLGFEANCFGARVYLDRPAKAGVPARTHLCLCLTIEGSSYLADVGFGGQTPTGPLLLDTMDEPQETPHEPYRIVPAGNARDLEAFVEGSWKLLYRFGLDEPPMIDLEVANHYVATYPTSFFRNAIMAARVTSEGRHTLINDRLSYHPRDGQKDTRQLQDAAALRKALAGVFGIDVPDEGKLGEAFARATAR